MPPPPGLPPTRFPPACLRRISCAKPSVLVRASVWSSQRFARHNRVATMMAVALAEASGDLLPTDDPGMHAMADMIRITASIATVLLHL